MLGKVSKTLIVQGISDMPHMGEIRLKAVMVAHIKMELIFITSILFF
jgi:hypothetical protein